MLMQEFPFKCFKCGTVYDIIHIFNSTQTQNTRKVEFYCDCEGNYLGSIVVAGLIKKSKRKINKI